MDELPSYEAATCPNAWTLIAPYLPSQALCSATLVSREWNKIFTPCLWGSPASHFGEQNDVVFVALTRFKRILPNARASVCELTHTLCLPPAHAEIYSGPHSEWLRDCLEYLPCLQCLIVNGLPFFDHASLLSLRYPSQRLRPKFPVFSLRLLDASGCMNATSAGLAEALPHFPDLVSLDLSKTRAARGKAVLSALKHLLNLRVINLCGIGLKDEDFSIVAHSIRSRVRSLDISNNLLTDTSTRLLLELCLKERVITPHTHRGRLAPVEQEQGDNEMDVFESENLVGSLRKKLTGGFVGTLPIEEARDVGISHLYLSANNITIEGISSLLRSGRLKVLDAGILPVTIRNPCPVDPGSGEDDMKLPSVAKLVPILSRFARHKLGYVRLNYQIVTEDAPIERAKSPRAELCGGLGAHERPEAHELENTELSMPELDSEFTTIQEIADSYPVELPGSFPSDGLSNHASSSTAASDHKVVAAPSPAPIITSQPSPSRLPPTPTPDMQFLSAPVLETICQENPLIQVEEMEARLSYRQSQEPRLHPGMLPNLHTLVLTSVPIAAEKYVVDRVIQFIKDAADEASIARQRARNTYALPPGRRRTLAEEEYARSLFALRRIVLEMASPQPIPKKISTSWRAYPTKSTTEDADSEAFWEAASHDFSFFGDEECGQPSQQLVRQLPLEAMSGLELATDHTHPAPESRKPEVSPRRLFDVIGEIGKFRRERKTAYDELLATGEVNPDVKGYWPGDITVVRTPLNAEVGEIDCYGNRYESGWYYR
ncbi:leucine rich repeat protein [Bipolaris maydis]|nr:leucine rich repeat protein [Bipolaris maydis]